MSHKDRRTGQVDSSRSASSLDTVAPTAVVNPDVFLRALLDDLLERGYLEGVGSIDRCAVLRPSTSGGGAGATVWVRLTGGTRRAQRSSGAMLASWQALLTALHSLGHRLVYLLLFSQQHASLFLGATCLHGNASSNQLELEAQVQQVVASVLPGIEAVTIDGEEYARDVAGPLSRLGAAGAITGLPSLRTQADGEVLQTLDRLAMGIHRTVEDYPHSFALVVIADPVADREVAGMVRALQLLGSNVHALVENQISQVRVKTTGQSSGLDLSTLTGIFSPFVPGIQPILAAALGQTRLGNASFSSDSQSISVSQARLNKVAQYCEQLIDKHVERLKQGRNLGYWLSGIYVLTESEALVGTITSLLRAVYSGDESYLEPIRTHVFKRDSGAADIVKQLQHIALPAQKPAAGSTGPTPAEEIPGEGVLPAIWSRRVIATALNTRELCIAAGLPKPSLLARPASAPSAQAG